MKGYVFICLAEGGGQIGYRCFFVSAESDEAAIGFGMIEAEKKFPDKTISTPSVIEVTKKKFDDIGAEI
jgi:hypothetical protein